MDDYVARASIMSDTSGDSYEFFLIAGPAVSITSHPLRPSTTHRSIHFGYEHRRPTAHTDVLGRAPLLPCLCSSFRMQYARHGHARSVYLRARYSRWVDA